MNPLFKKKEIKEAAEGFLRAPLLPPTGDVRQSSIFSAQRFSQWLCFQLEQEFQKNPDWLLAHPILLGSWGRQELSLKSDLDVLFIGEEKHIRAAVQHLNEQGYKLRSRMPANLEDWSEGVDLFDQLALLDARPLTALSAQLLFVQQKKIFSNLKSVSKQLIQRLKEERQKRNLRFDSVANYLEPNLKFGPGGLRDLQQAQQILKLFSGQLTGHEHATQIFSYYREFYLTLRNKINLLGGDDQFFAQVQDEVSVWLGFSDKATAMRQLQRGLERVHFYSDWLLDQLVSNKKHKSFVIKDAVGLIDLLKKDPSLASQKRVRTDMDSFLQNLSDQKMLEFRKKGIETLADPELTDVQIQSFFRSKLIHYILPEVKRLDGLVQHDQYHRYTVETHILQARREVSKVYFKKMKHKTFSSIVKSLRKSDWKVLCLLSLYHDLGKGTQKDHSIYGAQLAKKDLALLAQPQEVVSSVEHLTLRHLEISQAAFRKNPQAIATWKDLQDKEIQGNHLDLLVLWTAIDIISTNPDSWTPWKESLLANLYQALTAQHNQQRVQLQIFLDQQKIDIQAENFDQLLLQEINLKAIQKDIILSQKKKTASLQVFKGASGIWIRAFDPEDRVGLLKNQVQTLHSAGFGIQHALVQTVPGFGAYNWVKVSTKNLTQKQLEQRIQHSQKQETLKELEFVSFHFERTSENRGVLVFKAKDQNGFLVGLLSRLSQLGLNIQYAQIHTWGQRIEDSFEVQAGPQFEELCRQIESRIQEKMF